MSIKYKFHNHSSLVDGTRYNDFVELAFRATARVAAAGGPIAWGAAATAIGWTAAYASGATLVGQLIFL
jgi:hypothetical protein